MKNSDFIFEIFIMLFYSMLLLMLFIFVKAANALVNAFRRRKNYNYFKKNIVNSSMYSSNSKGKSKNIYKDVSGNILQTFNTDNIDSLKDFFYDIFYKFEMAYNNLDYNMMKIFSTKQLFQNYYTGISLDLQIGKKKVINDIKRENVIIYALDSTIARQTACVMIEISYITYTLNKDGNVISGNRNNPITEKFEVTFRKIFEREDIKKCPNCGATIVGNKCEYCRTTLKNVEFKISNIKRIID